MTDDADDLRADPDAEAVRRLLADARHTGPMPDDVAARMDALLADLAQDAPVEPVADPAPPPLHPVVVSLARQRRRRAAGMLVAAAAIVVGGVVVAQHLPAPGNSSGSAATAAGDRSESDSSLGSTTEGGARQPVTPGASRLDQSDTAAKIRRGRLLVRPQHFTADALAARRVLAKKAPASAYQFLSRSESSCVGSPARGEQVRATYQRAPAVLVFRAPGSGSQVVDLYLCGSSRPVRSATLPSP